VARSVIIAVVCVVKNGVVEANFHCELLVGGDDRGCSSILFLFKRIFSVVQLFDLVLLHDDFVGEDRPEYGSLPNKFGNLLL